MPKKTTRLDNCIKCERYARIKSKDMCQSCYDKARVPKAECSQCKKIRFIQAKQLCKPCYEKQRLGGRTEEAESKRLYQKEYRSRPENRVKERERNQNRKQCPEYREKVRNSGRKHRLGKYGLTLEQFEIESKDGCHLCGSKNRLCIDHCHDTGLYRGILCGRCNNAIGLMVDSPSVIAKAASYVYLSKMNFRERQEKYFEPDATVEENVCHAMNHLNEFRMSGHDQPHLANALTRIAFALSQAVEKGLQAAEYVHPEMSKPQ